MTNEELESQIALQERMNELLRQQNELKNQATNQTRTQTQVQSDFFSVFNDNSDTVDTVASSQSELANSLDQVANSQEGVTKQTSFMDKAMLVLSKSVQTVKTGFSSLMKVLVPLYKIITLQDVFGFLGTQTGKAAQNAGNAFESYQKFKDTLGIMPKTITKFNEFVKESSKTLANAGEAVGAFAGIEVGDVANKFLGYASEMGVGFDLFMEKAKGAYGEIIAFREGLGMSMDALEDLTYRFGTASFPDFAKQLVGGANDLGLSLKNVSKNFNAGIKDSKNFGYMTRKELTATSLYATKLGMEMSDLASFGNKFDTFEGAAESVGKLSAAFGIQLDTLDMVMEDNPAKKLDMVREALEKSGKSIDTILGDRRQAQYLADSIGLPIAQLEKLASVSTDDFGFTDALDSAAEAQENMSEQEALNMIADNIRDIKNSLSGFDKPFSGFISAFTQGFMDAYKYTAAYDKIMNSVKNSFEAFYDVGKKVADLVGRLFFDPSIAGQEYGDGKVMTAEDAPLFKYFFQPFIEYFDAMKGAAETLMAPDGPLDKVFDYIRSFLDPEKFGPVDENFNIFDTLFAPFRDVKKPNLLTPAIRKGLVKVAGFLVDGLSQAFRFIGTESIKWVSKLFDRSKETVSDPTTGRSMMDLGKEMFAAFGDMIGDLLKAAGGLSAFLVGGTFMGKTTAYEDSLIGKMLTDTADSDLSSGFQQIVGNLVGGIAAMFGNSELAEVFQKGGVGLGKKFEYVFLNVKAAALGSIASFVRDLSSFAKKSRDDMATDLQGNWMGEYSPSYMLFSAIAGKGDVLDNVYFNVANMASDAKRAAKALKTELDAAEQAYKDSFDSTGMFQESMQEQAPEIGKKIASDVNAGLGKGLIEEFPTSEIDDWSVQVNESIRTSPGIDASSPSMTMYHLGVDMADGLIAGFFGNERLIEGSEATGFINKFSEQMASVSQLIEDTYIDISTASVSAITAKLGRVGEILSGNKPMQVIVDNKQLQVVVNLNVKMDSYDVASAIASAPGGSYFVTNVTRDEDSEGFRSLEFDDFGTSDA